MFKLAVFKPAMFAIAFCLLFIVALPKSEADEIEIAELERESQVDFDQELLPVLRKNCLACHSSTVAESDLNLESVAAILQGSATGEVVVPHQPDESFLLQVSAHQAEPTMPPEDNSVGAGNLSPQELGIMRLWILQGAKESTSMSGVAKNKAAVQVRQLPKRVHPVYAVALSDDGERLAVGRGNQVSIYSLPERKLITQLHDPELANLFADVKEPPSHIDIVQAIEFAPHSHTLATSGYRTVKLWQPPQVRSENIFETSDQTQPLLKLATGQMVVGCDSGELTLYDDQLSQPLSQTRRYEHPIESFVETKFGFVSVDIGNGIGFWEIETDDDGLRLRRIRFVKENANVVAIAGTSYHDQVVIVTDDHRLTWWQHASFQESVAASVQKPPRPVLPARQVKLDRLPRVIEYIDSANIVSPATSPTVALAFDDNSIDLLSSDEAGTPRKLTLPSPANQLIWDQQRQRLYVSCEDGLIRSWVAADWSSASEFKGSDALQKEREIAQFELSKAELLERVQQGKLDAWQTQLQQTNDAKTKATEVIQQAETTLNTNQTNHEQAVLASQTANENLDKLESQREMLPEITQATNEQLQTLRQEGSRLQQELTNFDQVLASRQLAQQELLQQFELARQGYAQDPVAPTRLQQLKDVALEVAEMASQVEESLVERQRVELAIADNQKVASDIATRLAELQQQATDIGPQIEAAKGEVATKQQVVVAANQALATATRQLEDARLEEGRLSRSGDAIQLAIDQGQKTKQERTLAVEHHRAEVERISQRASELAQPIVAMTFDPETGKLDSIDRNGDWTRWNVEAGTVERTEHLDVVEPKWIESTASGSLVISGASGVTRVDVDNDWQVTSRWGDPTGESPFVDRVTALAFRPDGLELAAGSGEPSRSGQVVLLDLTEQLPPRQIRSPHSDAIWSLEYSPDGKRLATAAADRFMKVFDGQSLELIQTFEGHTHHVLAVSWSGDGEWLATASGDRSVKLWEAASGQQLKTLTGFGKEVTDIQFVGLGHDAVVSSGDQSVQLRRLPNGEQVVGLSRFEDFAHCVATTRNGQLLAAGSEKGRVRVWNQKGELVAEFFDE